jgi:hypothetical protein
MFGGSDRPSNLVLLCVECHPDAPDVGDPAYMLEWMESRPSRFTRWLVAMNDAIERAGLNERAKSLTWDQVEDATELTATLLSNWVGIHQSHVSPATVAAVAVETLRRLPSTNEPKARRRD